MILETYENYKLLILLLTLALLLHSLIEIKQHRPFPGKTAKRCVCNYVCVTFAEMHGLHQSTKTTFWGTRSSTFGSVLLKLTHEWLHALAPGPVQLEKEIWV